MPRTGVPFLPYVIKRFPTEREATMYARRYDYARACNALAPLDVRADGNEWAVWRDDGAGARSYRRPRAAV